MYSSPNNHRMKARDLVPQLYHIIDVANDLNNQQCVLTHCKLSHHLT
jgi:hypothetical protein